MTITLDATTTSTATAATSKSFSHTVGVAKRNVSLFAAASLLNDASGAEAPSNISVTYGGVSMVKVGEYKATSKKLTVVLFSLTKPLTGANTLAFSWTYTALGGFYAISLYGVNRPSPIRSGSYTTMAENNSATASISVPSNTGDWVLDVIASESIFSSTVGMTVGAGQTAIMNSEIQNTVRMAYGGSYEASTGSSVTMSWSKAAGGGYYAIMAGMSVQPGSEGGNIAVSPFMRF